MPSGGSPPGLYRVLIRLLSPLLLLYSVWRAIKDGGVRYLKERLGLYDKHTPDTNHTPDNINFQTSLWIHAASVGEVLTVVPLMMMWLKEHPQAVVLFTTNTPTGAKVLADQHINNVIHQYLPLDFPGACRRFLNQANVKNCWIVETEIWPWLFACSWQSGVNITIVNGRLSNKTSSQATGLLAPSYKNALRKVRILARSENDKKRFITLGAVPEFITTAGNLKNTSSPADYDAKPLINRPYLLAASTHDDEEVRLCRALLNTDQKKNLLVIAPRHPDRGAAICQKLTADGFNVAIRSIQDTVPQDCQIYIADTLGELNNFYQHALGTFVGGSLIKRGGHNIIEPARYACPTIVGPHTFNFSEIVSHYLDADAIKAADDEHQIAQFLIKASNLDPDLNDMGLRARKLAEHDSTRAIERYKRLLIDI